MPVIETVTLGEGARCSRIIRGGWQVHAATRFDAVEEAARWMSEYHARTADQPEPLTGRISVRRSPTS